MQDRAKGPIEIVLLHGYRGAPIGVAEIARQLRTYGYNVHTPAVPPFGGAELLDEYTPMSYAKFVHGYIQQNKLSRPVLIGHSMGTIVAAATAEYYPDSINQKTILLSPISKRETLLAPFSMLATFLPRKFVDYTTTRFLSVAKGRKLFRNTLALTNQCTAATDAPHHDLAQAGKFSSLNGVIDFDFEKDVLLIAGEKDRLVRRCDTERLAEKLRAKLVFLSGTGHIHNYEQPTETVNEIVKFLKDR